MPVSLAALPISPRKLYAVVQSECERRGLTDTLTVPDFWASQSHSTIRTQHGTVPFVPFPWQTSFIDGITPREMVLKSRDVGSSEICVRYFCWRQLAEGGNILIKADKHDNAKNLISIARQYLTSLPEGERPTLDKDNETELSLRGIGTIRAMAQGGGRSERCKYLLKTERAFWANAAEEEAAISGALVAGGSVIQESTANGYNDYHADWMDEGNGYRKTFVGRSDNPTHDAAWWAQKSAELAKQGRTLGQEYPATSAEAFVTSGNCVFESATLQQYREQCRPPIEARLNEAYKIWQRPVVGRRYVIGADVAEGIDAGNDRLDYSVACVLDWQTGMQVASLRGQWPLDLWAQMLDKLGREYNSGLVGVERNNHGHAVLLKLKDLQYPQLYYDEQPVGQLGARPAHALKLAGWKTDQRTKPIMESDFAAAIMAGSFCSSDEGLWDECLSYVRHGDGSTGAQGGCHDDRCIAAMIAWQLRKYMRGDGNSIVVGKARMR